jgi:mRNA interferase HigB
MALSPSLRISTGISGTFWNQKHPVRREADSYDHPEGFHKLRKSARSMVVGGLVFYLKLRYNFFMHIITRKTLIQFWEKHPDSRMALMRWFKIVQKTEFNSFDELTQVFPSADQLDRWIIFNIGGNKYRLITSIHFNRGKVYIRYVLTHAEYDRGDWKK